MSILYKKHYNAESNRVEYLFINFDYFDGNNLLSKLFAQEYNMEVSIKEDGIFYSITKLHAEDTEYVLVWHEDVGNYLYSVKQDESTLNLLEKRLKTIINRLNDILMEG